MTKLKEKANHTINDVFSIDETRKSLLMLMTAIAFGVAIYLVFTTGDIPPNLMQLLFVLIGAITSVQFIHKFTTKSNKGTFHGEYDGKSMRIESYSGDTNNQQEYYDDRV